MARDRRAINLKRGVLMKQILAVLTLVIATLPLALSQTTSPNPNSKGSAEDETAIKTIVKHWQEAWDQFNSQLLAGDYADDADWMNAYGEKSKGAANIVGRMARLFARPHVQGRRTTWHEPRIRFIRPDVAIAYADYETVGQKTGDGKEVPRRNTHSTWVLTEERAKWQIVSQVIMDNKE
jgi:uncharacterized protein (TIGR02246 family)